MDEATFHMNSVAIETIPMDVLARVWLEIDHQLDVCRATGGAHIEIY